MSHRRNLRRLASALVVASIAFAGCVSVAAAMRGEPTRVPSGEEQPIDWTTVQVIPYLSHGTLTAPGVKPAAARTGDDPFSTDVNVRPGESLGGPDGGPSTTRGVQQQPSVNDIGSDFAEECRRLLLGGFPDELDVCLDLGARGERVWTDRD